MHVQPDHSRKPVSLIKHALLGAAAALLMSGCPDDPAPAQPASDAVVTTDIEADIDQALKKATGI